MGPVKATSFATKVNITMDANLTRVDSCRTLGDFRFLQVGGTYGSSEARRLSSVAAQCDALGRRARRAVGDQDAANNVERSHDGK